MRVAVGLSGGVDSAVSAALLLEQGYEVTGVFLICYQGPGCRSDEDRKDALDVALKLNIPFEVLDYREAYQQKVLEYFKAEYEAGRTPNPDVLCNREIKFGLFYDWCMKQKYDYVATGHYAQTDHHHLLRAKDEHKDQIYFLYQLREEQLEHILFPIGGMTKSEVREKAKELRLPVADKPDSQGICFVGEVPAHQFLQKMGVKEKAGDVVNQKGEVIGRHKGAWFYTVGQRHGFTVNVKTAETPALYIIDKDVDKNILIVGTREEGFRNKFDVENIHWINQATNNFQVRIRHGGELINAKCQMLNDKCEILLEKAVFGVAPGQAAVFYEGDVCLGGGVIAV